MLIVKDIENNTMYSVQELHSFLTLFCTLASSMNLGLNALPVAAGQSL